jgi:hypothetical protein
MWKIIYTPGAWALSMSFHARKLLPERKASSVDAVKPININTIKKLAARLGLYIITVTV